MDNKLMLANLEAITLNNELVLTTEQLALLYGTDVNNIRMNFSNNKDRFESGVHYYCLEGAELKAFKNNTNDIGFVHKRINRLYLWTKRGASRHSKILDTDMSWNVFDKLEESYFKQEINCIEVKVLYLNGEPCTTVKEIMKAYRCSDATVLDCKDGLTKGIDYTYLMDDDLKKLIDANGLSKNISSAYIFFGSGIRKVKSMLENQGLKLQIEKPKVLQIQ